MLTLSPAVAGFLKGIILAALGGAAIYLSDASNLTGLAPYIATLIAALASSLESYLKAQSNNTSALFGSVYIK